MTNKEFENLSLSDRFKYNLPAMNAYFNNQDIQIVCDGKYYTEVNWTGEDRFSSLMFRIKPKTVKKWFNIYYDIYNSTAYCNSTGFESESVALENAEQGSRNKTFTIELEVPVVT